MLKIFAYIIILLYTFNINISTIYANLTNKNTPNKLNFEIDCPQIEAQAAILMDMETNTILYSKNENERHYPASITKILTTLIALEFNRPDDIITFSDEAVFGIDRSSSNLAIDVGEQISMEDALYGIMLMSANEVSAGVAEHIGGSITNFANLMNNKAKEIGVLNSNFKNPHGLHDPDHYTTAYDMALIAKEAYKMSEFRNIISTVAYQIEPTNKQPEIRYLANQHYMFKNTKYHYDACTGGKTGFTDEAQSTLVTFAEKDGLKLVCVVLYEIGNQKYDDTIALFDYGFNNFKTQALYVSDYPKTLPVYSDDKNLLGDVDIYTSENKINTIIPKNIDTSQIKKNIDLPEQLFTPLKQDGIVGKLNFCYDDKILYSIDLKNSQSYEIIPVSNIKGDIEIIPDDESKHKLTLFIAIMVLILLFVLLVCILIRKHYLKRRRRRLRWK